MVFFCAILGVNSPDHGVMFKTLSTQLEENVTSHIAMLKARDCLTLKTLITKLLQLLMQNHNLVCIKLPQLNLDGRFCVNLSFTTIIIS